VSGGSTVLLKTLTVRSKRSARADEVPSPHRDVRARTCGRVNGGGTLRRMQAPLATVWRLMTQSLYCKVWR